MVEITDVPDVWQCPPTQENGRSGGRAPSPAPVQGHTPVLQPHVRGAHVRPGTWSHDLPSSQKHV